MYVRPRPRFRPRNAGSGNTPSLALEFNQLSALPSYVTFSRGTQAMQYGSDGTLQYAPNNLLTYSNQADNAAWTKSNSFVQTNLLLQSQTFDSGWSQSALVTLTPDATTAPDGTLTADLLVPNTTVIDHRVTQTVAVTAGTTYTVSVYSKDAGYPYVDFVPFTLPSGTVASFTTTSTAASNGFLRRTCTFTVPAGDTSVQVRIVVNNGAGQNFAGNGTSGVYLWGAQLVQGSVAGDYRATTSAALPILYADYNGALRARKLCETAGAATTHTVNQTVTTTVGQAVTFSWYLKKGERNFALLYTNAGQGKSFNLNTGALGADFLAAPYSSAISSLGNGWYRCSITIFATAASTICYCYTADADASGFYAGDGSSGIYIADAQLTPGYLPLAVTETTSAAVYGPRFDYDPSSLVTQNLLTYSEPTIAQLTSNNNTSTASPSITGFSNSIQFGDNSLQRVAYKALTLTPVQHTISVFVQMDDGAAPAPSNFNTSGDFSLVFENNLVTTTLTTTLVSGSIYRISAAVTAVGTASANYGVIKYTTQSARTFRVTGFQINRGTLLPYTATTTAPYTLTTARGLLIEEQRVNLLLQSNDFQTSWTPVNITRTLNSTLSPEGVVNGVKIEATAAAATSILQTVTVAATSATFSVYVKQGTGATTANNFGLRNVTTLTNLVFGTLNYSTGVFTYTVGSSGVVVTNVGNGWWRIAITATTGITAGDLCTGYVGFIGNAQAAGDFLYAYGAQLEAGAFATSYIPTVASTATRNADSASITTLTPWFNAAAGTLYASFDSYGPSTSVFPNVVLIGTSAGQDGFISAGIDNAASATVYGGTYLGSATFQASFSISGANWYIPNRIAYAYATNDFGMSLNGGTVSTDISGSLPTLTTQALYIGAFSSSRYLNGHVRSLRYYPTRLPNASLQSITV